MATKVTNYHCPSCTGPLHFVGESGKLECDYCGSSFDVAEIEALYENADAKAEEAFNEYEEKRINAEGEQTEGSVWDETKLNSDWGDDGENMRAYNCPSCGAQIICDLNTAATSCPYCGNPSIIPGQFSGSLRPDCIIPFKLSLEDAKEALKKHCKNKFLLPKEFKDENHIKEMKGLYVPFWLYSANAEADCLYKATKSFTHRHGDSIITETDHFNVQRGGTVSFSDIPADASSKMRNDYMDSIEPFDYSEMKEFSTAYLPGFYADRYDVGINDEAERIDRRCKATAIEAMKNDIHGYDTLVPVSTNIKITNGKVKYALLPIWTLHTKWHDKDYLFMMNGQTGKIVGDLPVSRGRFWGLFAAVTAAVTALLFFSGIGTGIIAAFM